jgi:uncharacterized protein YqjF (DUF2071 family)
MLNYAIPEAALAPYLPPGCVPDTTWDGRAYASLVAFDFEDTRVLGIPWPGFRNFPEINLRLYVRRGDDRGVVFVSEFVPSRLVATIARLTYNEPYRSAKMASQTARSPHELTLNHRLTHQSQTHSLTVHADPTPFTPAPTTQEHFFKEQRWGFGKSRSGKLLRYEVAHPTWRCHPVRSFNLTWNFAALYGPQWGFLQDRTPDSTLLAEGSEIEVFVWQSLATPAERAKVL